MKGENVTGHKKERMRERERDRERENTCNISNRHAIIKSNNQVYHEVLVV